MNIAQFIAQRTALSYTSSFTKIIVRIAIVAIALSLTVMILTTSVIEGFKKEITQKIFGFWGHIHITDGNISRNFDLKPITLSDISIKEIEEIHKIAYQVEASHPLFGKRIKDKMTKSGVKSQNPFIIMPALLSTKNSFHGVLLKGVGKDYDWQSMEKFIIEGSKISFGTEKSNSDLLISKNIAQKLKLKLGDKVILNFIKEDIQTKKRFEICGIYNTSLEEYDQRFGLINLGVLQDILGWSENQVQGIEVMVDNLEDMDVIADYIYYDILPSKYYAETIRSKFPSIFEWLNMQDLNEKVIMVLMIIVAIINMITVLLILILERTHMIGVLKAIGMTIKGIRAIFLYKAAYIILIGLALGNFVGLLLVFLQKKFGFIKLDEANYYLDTAPVSFNIMTVFWLNIGIIAITLLSLILPTLLVAKINPIKALHFE